VGIEAKEVRGVQSLITASNPYLVVSGVVASPYVFSHALPEVRRMMVN
jgi:hypothetical protein